jgi:hypothetical protein
MGIVRVAGAKGDKPAQRGEKDDGRQADDGHGQRYFVL